MSSAMEHPVFAYLDVRQGLRRAEQNSSSWRVLPVRPDSTVADELSAELSALRQKEAHGLECHGKLRQAKMLSVGTGESLGTIGEPNVDALRALAKPTTTDGGGVSEVSASQLTFDEDAGTILNECAEEVGGNLFPERPIKLVLDRMVLYEPGARYAPRHEVPRAENHRGTLLMGCGPEYEDKEGTVKLYHPGESHEGAAWPLGDCDWVAFTSSLEYSMACAKSPVHLILHFDIYIEDESVERPNTVACVPPQDEVADDDGGEGDDDDDDGPSTMFLSLPRIDAGQSIEDVWAVQPKQAAPTRVSSEESLSKLVPRLTALVRPSRARNAPRDDSGKPAPKKPRTESPSKTARTVAFVLHHLYRQQTLTPDMLRGVDRALYDALRAAEPESVMKVDLHPVYVTAEAQLQNVPTWLGHSGELPWKTQIGHAGSQDAALEAMDAIPGPIVWLRREHTEATLISYQRALSHRCDHVPEKFTWYAGAMFIYFA